MINHLTYAGRLELIKLVLYGMVQFWLSIFPMPSLVIRKIIYICRKFLWTGNIMRNKFALVAWKTICLPKNKGGLGLFDIKARKQEFLSQTAMKHKLEI
jgi:hypothetical protein